MTRILGATAVFAIYVGLMFGLASSISFFPADTAEQVAASDEAIVSTQ